MLSLPIDVIEAIIHELLGRKDKATVKALSLVGSGFTALCQRHLLSHITISCSTVEDRIHGQYQRSSYAIQQLLQSSPHLSSYIRSLLIVDSGCSWTLLDLALLDILHSLTSLNSFTWRPRFISSAPTRWNELPLPLQNSIRQTVRRPSLIQLSLHFSDLSHLLSNTLVVSPFLEHLGLRGPGHSHITLKLTRSSIMPLDYVGETVPAQLFITACNLERIEDPGMILGWMSAFQPSLCLERLDKLMVFNCMFTSSTAKLPWGTLLYHQSVPANLEELCFDNVSIDGSPTG